ncbi:MAG: dipicolinate synthase subunit DpsA [Bacillota bacterium]|nr:dipicolinate synthase subunit DpsA [Bacillota bacterium]
MLNKIAFIGGDLRMPEAARFTREKCASLSVYGFDSYEYCYECFGITEEKSLEMAVSGAEAIVFGLPSSYDGINIYAPYSSHEISISSVISAAFPSTFIFGGKISKEIIEAADRKNITCYDYFQREELTIKNALITAEGALQTAMSETPFTIHNSRCLVIGYGRIGKLLAKMLKNLGAKVTCSARKPSDLALIECADINSIETSDIIRNISEYNIIFNTVPFRLLTEEILSFVHSDTLIIDLASKPGGLDFECARRLGLKVIWATALPGKVAPETSGKIISDTVFNMIRELDREVTV